MYLKVLSNFLPWRKSSLHSLVIVVGISSRIARNTDAGKIAVDVKMNPHYTALSCQAVLGTHGYVPGMSASELGHWWGRDSL